MVTQLVERLSRKQCVVGLSPEQLFFFNFHGKKMFRLVVLFMYVHVGLKVCPH